MVTVRLTQWTGYHLGAQKAALHSTVSLEESLWQLGLHFLMVIGLEWGVLTLLPFGSAIGVIVGICHLIHRHLLPPPTSPLAQPFW